LQRPDGSHQSPSRAKVQAKGRQKPKRKSGFFVAVIIILVAVAGAIYFYQSNTGTSTGATSPQTLVTGTLSPDSRNFTFASIFFISTTTRITYSAPVSNVTYEIRVFSYQVYNVTIEILASDGHHFCTTLPPSINVGVTGTMPGEEFACLEYGGPGV